MEKNEMFRLEELFWHGYLFFTEKPEHWIHSWDEGESYCYDCALKKVDELLAAEPDAEYCVDGGWDTEGDSTPFCENCFQLLSNTLTDYGCEEELCHFLDYCFDPNSQDDCRSMHMVIMSCGWESWNGSDEDYYQQLHALCRRIIIGNFWVMPDNDFRHMWD